MTKAEAEREIRSVAVKLRHDAPLSVRDKSIMLCAGNLVMNEYDRLAQARRSTGEPGTQPRYRPGVL